MRAKGYEWCGWLICGQWSKRGNACQARERRCCLCRTGCLHRRELRYVRLSELDKVASCPSCSNTVLPVANDVLEVWPAGSWWLNGGPLPHFDGAVAP